MLVGLLRHEDPLDGLDIHADHLKFEFQDAILMGRVASYFLLPLRI